MMGATTFTAHVRSGPIPGTQLTEREVPRCLGQHVFGVWSGKGCNETPGETSNGAEAWQR